MKRKQISVVKRFKSELKFDDNTKKEITEKSLSLEKGKMKMIFYVDF